VLDLVDAADPNLIRVRVFVLTSTHQLRRENTPAIDRRYLNEQASMDSAINWKASQGLPTS
jgi:hypothetical protein